MTVVSRLGELFATATDGSGRDEYRVGVKRAWTISGGLLMSGVTAMGCGGSPAATTTSAPTYHGSALAWLTEKARPFNKKLNDDQALVDTASAATGETDAATYFGHLTAACTRLADDARMALDVQAAPTVALASAWRHMATNTESYATDCLTLTRTRSTSALNRWNEQLKAMNSANGALNSVVNTMRGGSNAEAG